MAASPTTDPAPPAPRPRLLADVGRLVRQAARCFRAQAGAIIAVASLVIIGPAVIVSLLEEWVEHHDASTGNLAIALGTAVAVTVLGTIGSTFLAGLLDRLVGHHVHGHPFEGVGATFRTLPYGRLIAADLIVAVAVIVGTALLVVPGLIAYTLFAIVGPVIIIEDASVGAALRRSARLVRASFWLVFLSVTTITILESIIEEALESAGLTHHLVGEVAVTFAVGVLAGSMAALIKVCAAYELLSRDSGDAAVTGPKKG